MIAAIMSGAMGEIIMMLLSAGAFVAGGILACGRSTAEMMGGDSSSNDEPSLCLGLRDWSPVEQRGLMYLAHDLSNKMIWYQVNGRSLLSTFILR